MRKQQFYHLKTELSDELSTRLYEYLKNTVDWQEGIPSKQGHTRMAQSFSSVEFFTLIDDFPEVSAKIMECVDKYSIRKNCLSAYLNYYRNGDDWTPNHTHQQTTQLILSLGATRNFSYGKKIVHSANGDIIIFGSTIHGIPKQSEVVSGRISIALFLI